MRTFMIVKWPRRSPIVFQNRAVQRIPPSANLELFRAGRTMEQVSFVGLGFTAASLDQKEFFDEGSGENSALSCKQTRCHSLQMTRDCVVLITLGWSQVP